MLTSEVLIPALGYGAALPAIIAVVVVLPLALRARSEAFGRLLGGLAVGAAVLAATFALGLVPLKPDPEREWNWLPALTVAGTIVGAAGCCWPIRILGGIVLAMLATWLLIPAADTYPHRDGIRIALPIVVFAMTLLDRSIRDRGRLAVVVFGLTAAGAAGVLERGATASFAQLAGALAAALGGLWFAAHRPGVACGALPVVAVLIPGLLASGFFNTYSIVPVASYLLAALAPVALAFRAESRLRLAVVAAALAFLAIAVALAVRAEPLFAPTN